MLRILNVVFFAATVIVNGLANILPIAQVKTEDISQKYQHLLSPADFSFAIWGVIYVLLAGFVWYQALKKHDYIAKRCGVWFMLSCAANALWMVLWHYEMLALSVVCMGVIVWALTVINARLADVNDTWQAKVFVQAGLGLYLGWSCIAAAANAASFLVQSNFSGFGLSDEVWTVALLLLMALLTVLLLNRFGNVFTGIAVAWGIIGVLVQHFTTYQMRYGWAVAACIAALLIIFVRIWQLVDSENAGMFRVAHAHNKREE